MPSFEPETLTSKNFVCRRCGACCHIRGVVRIKKHEIEAAAACLKLEPNTFIEHYTVLNPDRGGLALAERDDGSCVMLDPDNTCRIHAVKPNQCKTFPWKWRNEDSTENCPGIGGFSVNKRSEEWICPQTT